MKKDVIKKELSELKRIESKLWKQWEDSKLDNIDRRIMESGLEVFAMCHFLSLLTQQQRADLIFKKVKITASYEVFERRISSGRWSSVGAHPFEVLRVLVERRILHTWKSQMDKMTITLNPLWKLMYG